MNPRVDVFTLRTFGDILVFLFFRGFSLRVLETRPMVGRVVGRVMMGRVQPVKTSTFGVYVVQL